MLQIEAKMKLKTSDFCILGKYKKKSTNLYPRSQNPMRSHDFKSACADCDGLHMKKEKKTPPLII